MALVDMVAEVFASGGVLERADAHFQPREGQTQMARAVARTIEEVGGVFHAFSGNNSFGLAVEVLPR